MMAYRAVLHFLCVLGVFQKGLTALIETQQTVHAAVGEEACLYCCLMQSRDVLQVTWQKILPDGEKNMATYSERFGERVNAGFQSKLEFRYAGLQNTSIVIRRVMEEDEGCYRCMFNTFSEGALTATTCLQLYELHGPFLHVSESTVVSCSATARPAPTVTLTVPHYNSTSVTNTNGTVTVTATAGLSGLHGNITQVGCAVRVLSGPQIEVSMMIPEVKQSSDDDFTLIIVLLVVCVCVAAVVIALLIRKHQNRRSHGDYEKKNTPQKAIKDTHEPKIPLMKEENELRLQTSTEKDKNRNHPKPSSLKGRKLSFNSVN
ncbi:OX-2 membrane glycoprotein-like [Sebastes umbrosus]|uniref:OX-2 membrane glycoprotein-like n=1 Tax=Sebastes umbrosus TaxID=72105 RepID=UPI00189EB4A8|nr:OX-2 membrane glycoprotein-like [Sebastes umbrosus]